MHQRKQRRRVMLDLTPAEAESLERGLTAIAGAHLSLDDYERIERVRGKIDAGLRYIGRRVEA